MSPFVAKWIILIEQVVLPGVVNQPVGIIDPVLIRGKMILGPVFFFESL
jgi:hypothetical protein